MTACVISELYYKYIYISQAICPNFEALSPQQYKRSFNIEFKIKERLATFAEEGIRLFVEKSCAREY